MGGYLEACSGIDQSTVSHESSALQRSPVKGLKKTVTPLVLLLISEGVPECQFLFRYIRLRVICAKEEWMKNPGFKGTQNAEF